MKIAVIGVGSMGQNHARVLDEMDCLLGVADTNKEVAKKVGKRFGVPWFTKGSDLLRLNPDGVTISTPASTHLEVALDVIDHGIPLLVEKPLARKVEEAEEMIKAAEKKNVLMAVGMIERYNPVVSTTKTLLSDGDVGNVISISSRRVSSFPSRVSDTGVIFDLAIHDIDVMRYLLDDKVVEVYTLGGPTNHGDKYEDHANLMIKFSKGVTGVLEVNWLTPHKVRSLAITCSKDYIEVDYIAQSLIVTSSRLMEYDVSNLFDIPLEHNIRKFSVKRQEPLKREMNDFMESIEKKSKPLVDGNDGMESMRVVEAAHRSLIEGTSIKL